MITAAPARRLWAAILSLLLVGGGLTLGAAPAHAATGDVSTASLDWGVKTSFRNYISGPIAHGGWTTSGNVGGAFSWTGGAGSADTAASTGAVAYDGAIHFTGHENFGGIGAGKYALDLTLSNVRVQRTSATAATIIVDTVSNSLSTPTEFVTSTNVNFASVDLTSTATSSETAVTVSGAPAVLTAAGAAAFAGFYAEGDALDPVSFSWPVEAAPLPPVPATPTVVVSKTTELSSAGEVVTVTGTGFSPNAPATTGTRPPLAGKFGGAYVVFGKFADTWKPSAGAPSSARKIGTQVWVVNPEDAAALGSQAVAIAADGSFSLQLRVDRALDAQAGNYGIYTYGGSGASYAPFETYTPLSFSAAPAVAVSKTADLSSLGETVTVKGYNFVPNAPATSGTRPPLAGKFGGAYVVFGKFADTWKPSAWAPSSARKIGSQIWAVSPEDAVALGSQAVAIGADGSFSVQLRADRALDAQPGNYGIYTYSGSGAAYVPFESYTPVTFTAAAATSLALTATAASEGQASTLTATLTPTAAGTVTFREGDTVIGTAPSESAVATASALAPGRHTFTAEFVPAAPLLFAGSSATVSIDVAANQPAPVVEVASGSLTWGIKDSFRSYVAGPIAQGSITTSGVTSSGSSFVFGQAAGGSFANSTGSVNYSGTVRFRGHGGLLDVALSNPVIVVESASRATLSMSVNGGASTPFATLNLAAGTRSTPGNTVTYSGVPAVLTSAGSAVFSLNGSTFYPAGTSLDPVSFSIGVPAKFLTVAASTVAAYRAPAEPVVAPEAPTITTLATCPVDDGTLTWGFKESFRSYISGSIANGEWTTADGATYATPDFGWTGGTGTYDGGAGLVGFTGSITFTGHGGVLNTTVANPQLEFIDDDTAVLLLDVSGTTQGGDAVNTPAVRFADIDLTTATLDDSVGTVTVTGAEAELTPAGSAAFGTYEAGESLDPVSFTVTTSPDCDAAASATPAPSSSAESAAPTTEPTASDAPNLWWILWVVLALIVIAIIVSLLVRRSRAA